MADGNENLLSPTAQSAQPVLAEAAPNTTQDSSATMSLPPSSGSDSPDMTRDILLSPTQSSHPLPARPTSTVSSTAATPVLPQPPTPVTASAPRTRGGFEVDDDEENEETEESKDDLDVYDPAAGFDVDPSTPAPVQSALDRTSQSPEQENGFTPVPVQITDNPTGASPSALPTGEGVSTWTGAATPPIADHQVQAAPLRPDVNASIPQAALKTRLSHDTIGILEDRIRDDPRGDSEAYLELINELKSRNKQDEVRSLYERYLKVFPLDAQQWCTFVKWEEENDRKFQMEQIFSNSLLEVLNVELWSIYINYIRRRNSMQTGDVAKAYTIINQAFSFALDTIGVDKDSGKLWQDYIGFLKTGPGTIGGTGWQDGAKVDTLRAAYQRAIAVPTEATTTLWREYDSFETGLSKINGRKYLQEKSGSYMTARQAYHQLSNLAASLKRSTQPQLPPAMGYSGDQDYMRQLNLWQDWIKWEKEDNLVLKDDEPELYKKRVVYAYKQALMALYFWPETWYSAAEFCFENGLDAEGIKFLDRGFAANPESPLLAFKQADRLESTTQNDEVNDPGARERMKKVREPYDKVLDALYALVNKTDARQKEDIQQLELNAESNVNGDGAGDDDVNAVNIASKKAVLEVQIQTVKKSGETETELLSKMISHVWAALVRATRRIQGKGSQNDRSAGGFRGVFAEARKRGKLTSEFYVECAQIEWQCYRDPAGAKIFERGIKLFPEDGYLPLHYIKHLFETNDATNARGVFETTVTKLLGYQDAAHTARTRLLFAYLHEYESKFGDLGQIQKLEKRMQQVFPDDPQLKLFAERHMSDTFDPIHVFPIISRQQTKAKSTSEMPSVDAGEGRSPIQKTIDAIAANSPKRSLPDDFEDQGPRKMVRVDSPLKGAAGRRVTQQKQPNGLPIGPPPLPLPPPLPPQVHYLLSVLPKASLYNDVRFIPGKVVEKLREIHLPPPGSMPPQPAPQPPSWQQPLPQFQHHQQPPHLPPQGYIAPPSVSQPQYGAPYRFS